jgi:hypothetical protein
MLQLLLLLHSRRQAVWRTKRITVVCMLLLLMLKVVLVLLHKAFANVLRPQGNT